MTGAGERARAARLLHRVVAARRTIDQVLGETPVAPLVRELVLGTLRHYFSLEAMVDGALHRPMKDKDQDLRLLMMAGAYQLHYLRVPDHAAIFETVEACGSLGKPWARGLVNAVLRRCAALPGPPSGSEHPLWLEEALRRQYADAEAVMVANNERAPMALRVNLARISATDYVARLHAAGINCRPPGAGTAPGAVGFGPETLVLPEACPVEALPGHQKGLVSVQDAGAQFAPGLLEVAPGDRVLDACAAPGGKLFHIMERQPAAQVFGLERNPTRLAHLREEGQRLGHRPAGFFEADATENSWWDGEPFRRLLLDAPCSGTGTLRRHPDIKVLRRAEDLATMSSLQARLLTSLWRVLEPGGTLLYCTCSILAEENDDVVAEFLAQHQDACAAPFELATGRATRHGWQLLPTDKDTDGFYYARMIKASA